MTLAAAAVIPSSDASRIRIDSVEAIVSEIRK